VIERERKFLVRAMPADLDAGTEIAQGYLCAGDRLSVRVRRKGDAFTFTVKGGAGLERTEVNLPLDATQFEELWPLTGSRRVEKVRHEIPLGDLTAELDRFTGDLDGLCIVEVEFSSSEQASAFEPPDWFGQDVTDDPRFTNAWIAEHGRPG
jgi:CYTH domain-containing protein